MTPRNRQILVVDDNQTIHEDFRKILCPSNSAAAALDEADAILFGQPTTSAPNVTFQLDSALQGQEAFAMVQNNLRAGKRYAMAFVDVRMPPGWDGIDTVARIWELDPEIQIVICTAYSEYSWDDMLTKLGHTDKLLILKKPFDNIEVQQLAHALTEKWHLLQERKDQLTHLEERVAQRTQELLAANQKLESEIAERRKTEEALRQSRETVLRQERLAVVGQLSAGVAHEFNNILTVIQGHTSLLLGNENHDERTSESLHHISNSAERAATLTRQMLAFGRKQFIRHEAVDLGEMIHRMGAMLGRILYENIKIRCTPAANLPRVWADPGMMEQVIMNLVMNARDAMQHGGELVLSAMPVHVNATDLAGHLSREGGEKRAGSFVCLRVSDTGSGMDSETQAHIFEPFFTTKDVGKGTGLGLATVYGIVQQHEGWIEVTSSVGQGSQFDIYLPVAQATTPPALEVLRPRVQSHREKILVVEDEPALRNLARLVLVRHGFQVFEACSGRDALRVWEEINGDVDVLFTDLMMPDGLLGNELAERLKAANPKLRVVYTSGYSEEVVDAAAVAAGDQFLAKPYKPSDLVRVIECILQRGDSAVG